MSPPPANTLGDEDIAATLSLDRGDTLTTAGNLGGLSSLSMHAQEASQLVTGPRVGFLASVQRLTAARVSGSVLRKYFMQARLVEFGEIEVEKQRYEYDVVIEAGKVRKRKKGPSKRYRDQAGHTPLSIEEKIPWGGNQLIVGTGAYGRLPVMPEVQEEARQRGIKLVVVPTEEACQLLSNLQSEDAFAILHTTC